MHLQYFNKQKYCKLYCTVWICTWIYCIDYKNCTEPSELICLTWLAFNVLLSYTLSLNGCCAVMHEAMQNQVYSGSTLCYPNRTQAETNWCFKNRKSLMNIQINSPSAHGSPALHGFASNCWFIPWKQSEINSAVFSLMFKLLCCTLSLSLSLSESTKFSI